MTDEEFGYALRKLAAFQYFSDATLSSGQAARLAGMNRVAFLFEASKRKIDWLPYGKNEVRREIS